MINYLQSKHNVNGGPPRVEGGPGMTDKQVINEEEDREEGDSTNVEQPGDHRASLHLGITKEHTNHTMHNLYNEVQPHNA